MNRADLIGLMNAYGFEVEKVNLKEYKTRFRGENTFIDVWEGRRGMTIGVYNPRTKKVWFERRTKGLEQIEDALIRTSSY